MRYILLFILFLLNLYADSSNAYKVIYVSTNSGVTQYKLGSTTMDNVSYSILSQYSSYSSKLSFLDPNGQMLTNFQVGSVYYFYRDTGYLYEISITGQDSDFNVNGLYIGSVIVYQISNISISPISKCPSLMQEVKVDDSIFPGLNFVCKAGDLNKTECESKGGYYVDPSWAEYAYSSIGPDLNMPVDAQLYSLYGSGCIDLNWHNQRAQSENFSFLVGGFLADIPGKFLARFANTIFAGGKKLYQWVLEKLGLYDDGIIDVQAYAKQLEFKDVKIQDDSVVPLLEWKDMGGPRLVEDTPMPYPPDAPLVDPAKFYENLPDPRFVDEFKPAFIHGKKILDDMTDIPLTDVENIPSGTTKVKDIELPDSILNPETRTYTLPITKIRDVEFPNYRQTEFVAETPTKVKIKVTKRGYPDGSYIKIYNVSYPVKTGYYFQRIYEVTSSGEKTYTSPPQITDGTTIINNYTYNNTNNTTNNSNYPENYQEATNLDPILQYLRAIQANQVEQIQKQEQILQKVDDMWNYRPPNADEGSVTLNHFNDMLQDWGNVIDSAFDFIENLKADLENIKNQFEQAKQYFEDKPQTSLPTGTCGFTATFYHHTYQVDPCRFVAPYRPLLTLFFTLMFSINVFFFALKYMFDIRIGD